ncbi:hypothetical protein EEJ42_08615 [Streptomyces botrytidirepellens]|uniref:Uncharacterized protein n=1 Tax=Streptomyces botrytidirepellens TaxID=2486417 RepID=A0A3M8WPJ0_9ACTN|nr:hypothetical protein EEJ42_08615 [Streptomyces botrytidirepellens]
MGHIGGDARHDRRGVLHLRHGFEMAGLFGGNPAGELIADFPQVVAAQQVARHGEVREAGVFSPAGLAVGALPAPGIPCMRHWPPSHTRRR